jgi:hypothetical protein
MGGQAVCATALGRALHIPGGHELVLARPGKGNPTPDHDLGDLGLALRELHPPLDCLEFVAVTVFAAVGRVMGRG